MSMHIKEGTLPSFLRDPESVPPNSLSVDAIVDLLPSPVASGIELGGPVSVLLVILSFISMTVITFKSIEITREQLRNHHTIKKALKHWQQARYRDAVSCLSSAKTGVGRILWVAMQGRQTKEISESALREEIQRLASNHIERLRRYLRLLENIGTVSPLLGLFGTVLGMIEAFRQMESAGSQVDPAVLSGGIWQALLTTGVGLAVAIPTVLAHQWLERRVDRHVHELEDVTTQVFTANTLRRIQSPDTSHATA